MGCFFSLFSELLSNKTTGQGNEATDVVFSIRTCESCTRPISTNPGSMVASEYGLTRWTCFVAHRLDVVAVAGLLWISWCVFGGANFSVFFFRFCFSSNAHGLLQV